MNKVSYPAIFHKENNSYWVGFPNLEGCFTCGDAMETAYTNAREALSLFLSKEREMCERVINKPSDLSEVCKLSSEQVVIPIEFDVEDERMWEKGG